jgi:predicted aspartyl protease
VTSSSQQRFCRTFLSIAGSAAVLVAELIATAQVTYARADTHFEAIPLVRSRQNHLMVRAFINGKEAWLTIDSGAPVSAIAVNRRKYFRLKPTTAKSNLPARIQINGAFNNVAIARELRLGGLTLVDEPVVTVDLGYSARAAQLVHEEQIDGIIGADILFPTQAVLDCQRQLLILKTDPDALGGVPGFDRRGLQAVPIQVSDDFNLYVNGSINGKPAKFMVDTGSFATLLHRSFVRRMRIATRETPFSSSAVNLKERGLRLARIHKLSVGSVDIVGKDVGVIDMEGLIHDGLLEGSPPVAGLLGAETLRRHHGIIDFGTRTLYLQKHESLWQRSPWRRSAGPNLAY